MAASATSRPCVCRAQPLRLRFQTALAKRCKNAPCRCRRELEALLSARRCSARSRTSARASASKPPLCHRPSDLRWRIPRLRALGTLQKSRPARNRSASQSRRLFRRSRRGAELNVLVGALGNVRPRTLGATSRRRGVASSPIRTLAGASLGRNPIYRHDGIPRRCCQFPQCSPIP
jgi:hypothetical protein